MKRSYPYTGPGASPSPAQAQQMAASSTPSTQQTPDYSAYGYGANSALMAGSKAAAGLSQEAQQAQWHQQWQQYYAQQAASTAAGQGAAQGRPPQQMQQPQAPMQSQPFGFQPQPQYYGQQYQQQASIPPVQHMPNGPYAWPNQQPVAGPSFPQQQSTQLYNAAIGQQQQPASYHPSNPTLPPAKRPRFEMNGQQQNSAGPMRPMNPMHSQGVAPGFQGGAGGAVGPQAFPGAPIVAAGGHQNLQNGSWQNGGLVGPAPARVGPMRGGGLSPHPGGPSNMAGPMAASPPGVRVPSMPRGPSRPVRPQAMPNRPMAPSLPAGQAGKFNGPVGVNAMTPQGRGGPSRAGPPAGPGARRPIAGLRNGIPSGPSGKGNRFDQGKGKMNNAAKGSANKASGEVNKIPIGTSRVDQASAPSSSKRTFSDFRIKGLSIEPLNWQWHQTHEEEDGEDEADGDDDDTMQSSNEVDSVNGSVQGTKKARLGKKKEKTEASKESSRLRICFAANVPPLGAPTGPRALIKADGIEEPQDITAADVASASDEPEWTAFSRGPPQSSTNRISISYASSKRRLVIDSDVVKSIEIDRGKGTLKIVVAVTTAAGVKRRDQLEKKKGEEWVIVKGVLLEGREAEMDNFTAISRRELETCWRTKGKEVEGEEEEEGLDVKAREDERSDETGEATPSSDAVVKEEADGAESTIAEPGIESQIDAEDQKDTGEGDSKSLVPELVENEEVAAEETKAEDAEAEVKDVAWQDYISLPPLFRLLARHDGPSEDENHSAMNSVEMTITVMLAEVSPKQELRWVKTGDVEEWLSTLPGFSTSLASPVGAKAVHAWTDKIRVVDPDPPPTVSDVLQDWMNKSFVGSLADRKRFLEVHQLQTTSGMTDLICKLVRGERAVPTPNARELGTPLREAMEGNLFQQNHLTCGIMAIVRLVKEYAGLAGIEESAIEARLQAIFMCFPTHQVFRGCDGLLKEYLEKQRLSNAGRAKAAVGAVAGISLPAGPVVRHVEGAAEKEEDKAVVVKNHQGSEKMVEEAIAGQKADGEAAPEQKGDTEVKGEDASPSVSQVVAMETSEGAAKEQVGTVKMEDDSVDSASAIISGDAADAVDAVDTAMPAQ